MTKDFPRMPLPLTVIETNQQEKTNEFSETIHLSKKTQGEAPDKHRVVSSICLAANLHDPIYHRAIGNCVSFWRSLSRSTPHVQSHLEAAELWVVTLSEACF
jgi:hypothetical protein